MSATFTLINPTTGQAFREVARATVDEVDEVVARAVAAQRGWAGIAPVARADALRRFARVVEEHVEELAQLEVLNSGHPIESARWEASHVAQVLNFYAGSPERLSGQQIPVSGGLDVTFHEPYGVVGVIVPWNFPMTIASWAFAPALAAGNAVVLKPAELTPLTAVRLGELAVEAGLPEGLFAVITGSGSVVGERFVTHPDVRSVVFTGSTEVGISCRRGLRSRPQARHARARRQERQHRLRRRRPREGCRRSPRLGVRQRRAGLLRAQPDSRPAIRLRPVPRAARTRRRRLAGRRPGARVDADGATHLVGASRHRRVVPRRGRRRLPRKRPCAEGPLGDGFWFAPTVVLAQPDDRIAREEVFGPVVAVLPFDDEADGIRLANDTAYGLAGSLWTENLGRAVRVSRAVKSGVLSVNSHSSVRYWTPFGGMKASGLGRELGPDAAEHFTETKNVFFATDA